MQLFSTFLLVSVFFSMFTAAMGIHGEERVRELNEISDDVRKRIKNERQKLQGEVIDAQPTPAKPAEPDRPVNQMSPNDK
jgi:divalent metal cation (Fe/Co/Zn/Cd) transporter